MNPERNPPRRRGARAALILVAVLTLAAYGILWTEPLWLGATRPFHGNAVGPTSLFGLNTLGALRFAFAMALPFANYAAALTLVPRVDRAFALRVALVVAAGAPLILLYTYPTLAADVFDYLISGRIVAHYHANPYVHTGEEINFDGYYPPVGWKTLPTVYGPAWTVFSAGVVGVSGSRVVLALVLEKLLAVLAHLGCAALVYGCAKRLTPGREVFAFVAYAWNPALILYFAVDGHNDAVMLLFVLGALNAGLRQRWDFSLVLLALGALVKFVPGLLIPLVLWQGRREPRKLLVGTMVAVVVTALFFLPFWAGMGTFDGVRDQAARYTSSPASLLALVLPGDTVRRVTTVVFGVAYVAILRSVRGLTPGMFAVLLAYLFISSSWTKGWYFSWLLALGAILGGPALWASVLAVAGALASSLIGAWGWEMDWLQWRERWGRPAMEIWLTAATYGGWLLAGVMLLWPECLQIAGRRRLRPKAMSRPA